MLFPSTGAFLGELSGSHGHQAVAPAAPNDVGSCSNATEAPDAEAIHAEPDLPPPAAVQVIEDITAASAATATAILNRKRKRYRCSRKMDPRMLFKKHKKNDD
jgi:hypothetical protein